MTQTLELLTITAHDKSYRLLNPGGRIGSKLVNGEPYEKRLLEDVYQRQLSGTALDVGAHVGNHTLYFAAVCGLKVIAIEANSQTFRRLETNIALNPTLDITAMHCAAGAKNGRGRLSHDMTIKLDRGHIPIRPIDQLLDIEDLAVVKIDVEGMEPQVITGMTRHLRRSRPVVYAECHSRTAEQNIEAAFRPAGYALTGGLAMGSTMLRWEHP
jgi:FkbM family methyltransferase